jgi:hypothetical protein
MRHRVAVPLVAVLLAAAGLAGCGDGQLPGAIQSALPTSLPTGLPTGLPTALPTLPGGGDDSGGGGTDTGGGGGGGTDDSGGGGGGSDDGAGVAIPTPTLPVPTQTATPTPTPTPTPTAEVVTPLPTQTPSPSPESPADDSGGVPLWEWLLLAALVIGLIAALVAARRRRSNDRELAAHAEGQLAWVRSQVDDPLVRWRGQQLGLPVEARDTDSELARRWDLLDQRTTAATDDLLTLATGAKKDSVREAATLLRQATETYRGSLDTLATAVSLGDQARITQASQGFTADTTLFDQARQRFRQATGL